MIALNVAIQYHIVSYQTGLNGQYGGVYIFYQNLDSNIYHLLPLFFPDFSLIDPKLIAIYRIFLLSFFL